MRTSVNPIKESIVQSKNQLHNYEVKKLILQKIIIKKLLNLLWCIDSRNLLLLTRENIYTRSKPLEFLYKNDIFPFDVEGSKRNKMEQSYTEMP